MRAWIDLYGEDRALNPNFDIDCEVLRVIPHWPRTTTEEEVHKRCIPIPGPDGLAEAHDILVGIRARWGKVFRASRGPLGYRVWIPRERRAVVNGIRECYNRALHGSHAARQRLDVGMTAHERSLRRSVSDGYHERQSDSAQ